MDIFGTLVLNSSEKIANPIFGWSRDQGGGRRFNTNEFLNMRDRLGEAGTQAIGLSSLETGGGFVLIAAESPDANYYLESRKPFPDLFTHGAGRCECVGRHGRDTHDIAVHGFN